MKSEIDKNVNITSVVVFGIFFGLLEATVVIYLRQLIGIETSLGTRPITSEDIAFTLGFIALLKPSASLVMTQNQAVLSLELWRELATIVMLACLAFVAGRNNKEKLLYFFLVFGLWDLFYYIFLRLFIGWPASLWDLDIYFLIPVAWVGPVITPVIISSIMIVVSFLLLRRSAASLANTPLGK